MLPGATDFRMFTQEGRLFCIVFWEVDIFILYMSPECRNHSVFKNAPEGGKYGANQARLCQVKLNGLSHSSFPQLSYNHWWGVLHDPHLLLALWFISFFTTVT